LFLLNEAKLAKVSKFRNNGFEEVVRQGMLGFRRET